MSRTNSKIIPCDGSLFSSDPQLSANIYCAGGLDSVICRVVAPFWRRQGKHLSSGLWVLRYGCGGEHLKLRMHIPDGSREQVKRALEKRVQNFFCDFDADPVALKRSSSEPPIDLEDYSGPYQDQTMVWTTYRAHAISLGGKVFFQDDQYRSRMSLCLARGSELVMNLLKLEGDGRIPYTQRHHIFIKLIFRGLAALGIGTNRCVSFLAYYRDTVLRTLAGFNSESLDEVRKVYDQIEARVQRMEEARKTLAIASKVWEQDKKDSPENLKKVGNTWDRALVDLYKYTVLLCQDPVYHLDPNASEPAFSVCVKILQGLSNNLGLNLVDEGFVLHLMLNSVAPCYLTRPII